MPLKACYNSAWPRPDEVVVFTLFRQRERVQHLAFSPSGLTLAAAVAPSGAAVERIRTWDLVERKAEHFLDPGDQVVRLTFVRDDETLVVQTLSRWQLSLVDVPTGQRRPLFAREDDPDFAVFVEDGELVTAAFVSRMRVDASVDVRQVDVSTGQESRLAQFPLEARISNLALRPGRPVLLAVEEEPNRLVLHSPGQLPEAINGARGITYNSLSFAPGGRTLALRTDRAVRLWDVKSRRPTAKVVERTLVTALAFSPDGRTVATGTNGGLVRFHDTATGQERAAFDWQVGPVRSLAFAPDGMKAAAGGQKGTIVVWDVDA